MLASHATNDGWREPCLWYTPSGLPLNGSKPFPMLKKLLSHISKWEGKRYVDLLITTSILRYIEACSSPVGTSSEAACIVDATCLGLQT